MTFWNDPINVAYTWATGLLTGWGLTDLAATIIAWLVGGLLLATFAMVVDIFLVWIERKVVSRFQGRIGPNRIGPFGLIQPFADIIKLLIKEDIVPTGADKLVFTLAPIISMASVVILWAVVPLAPTIFGTDLNVAVLYIIAAGALGTLSVIMAGWGSNNKYALLGAYRTVATMISYEIPMVVMLLIPVVLSGKMGFFGIINAQDAWWCVVYAPAAVIIFLICAIAELGRAPFDLNEGESEIVAGFHIEYSGMKFGMFYAGELLHTFTFGGIIATLFFGGYRFFGWEEIHPLVAVLIFFAKSTFFYWIIMWVKYTMMRIRIDHMLAFNWKFLTPVSFALLILVAIMNNVLQGAGSWVYALGMFLSNVVFAWIIVELLRSNARREREAKEPAAPVAEAAHH
jgi:NADH-quinone oxidoreductase subunit H